MLTLFGTGGIGKTRLALEVADEARDRYPAGVVYVDLDVVSEPSLVIPTIAEMIGLQGRTGAALGAGIETARSGARMLIVLDNMEHLAEAAPELADLLGAAPLRAAARDQPADPQRSGRARLSGPAASCSRR